MQLGIPFDQYDTLVLLDQQIAPDTLVRASQRIIKFDNNLAALLENLEV